MKNHYYVKIFLWIFISGVLTSCLQEKAPVDVASTASWFGGVVSAKNSGGPSPTIRVSWNSASRAVAGYRVYALTYDPVTKTNKMTKLADVDSDTTSYPHSQDIMSGSVYTYMVRAVDADGKEDSNNKQVSTVAFAGVTAVTIDGTTRATVTLESSLGSFDEVRIYAQPDRPGAAKVKVATATGEVERVTVTGLQSGVRYKFFANVSMSYLGTEDGNEHSIIGQTHSESFGSGQSTENTSIYAYRGMLSVQAFGDAPNAPVAPTSRMVRLTWLPFNRANSATVYRVIRAEASRLIDAATTLSCSTTTDVSCIVNCTNVGPSTQTCEDWNVALPPKTYNYVVTLVKSDEASGTSWAEELPTVNATDFYTKVSIPPTNMVLVQRDAANYEMCQMLGAESIPRKHQRCAYTGIAGTPFNAGPGKAALNFDNGFYDFGYNLFIDRYQVGCNWTRVSPACGANGCIAVSSSMTSNVAPPSGLGQNGDVLFYSAASWGATCYYKKGGAWMNVGSENHNLTPAELRATITIDPQPDKKTPTMSGFNQTNAFNACNVQQTEYGTKRLMRRREYVQAAAFPTLPGEPNAITNRAEAAILRVGYYDTITGTGAQQPGYRRCAGQGYAGYYEPIPLTLSDILNSANNRPQMESGVSPVLGVMTKPYFIGTVATSNCISRWGSQDIISPDHMASNPVFADTFARTNDINEDPAKFTPVDSDFDSGVVKDWFNSTFTYQFNGVSGPAMGVSTSWLTDVELQSSNANTYKSFVLPLGVPLIPATNTSMLYSPYMTTSNLVFNGVLGGNVYGIGPNAIARVVYRNSDLSAVNIYKYVMLAGRSNRFSYVLHPEQTTTRFGVWCALEAE